MSPAQITAFIDHYRCSLSTACDFADLLEEGYPRHQALVMVGLADPAGDEED